MNAHPAEPPWYGPVCPVVWEGRHREVPPYPDSKPPSSEPASLGDHTLTASHDTAENPANPANESASATVTVTDGTGGGGPTELTGSAKRGRPRVELEWMDGGAMVEIHRGEDPADINRIATIVNEFS